MSSVLTLVKPAQEHLAQYKAALEKGWSPDNLRLDEAAREELEKIETDPVLFLERMHDVKAEGGNIKLPDGSDVKRLPGFRLWLWDGDFCGSIGARWQQDSNELPKHVLGHVGYSVVPWKRRKGYATKALALLLPQLAAYNLSYIYVTTQPDNGASQKVITANGGVFVEEFTTEAAYGNKSEWRYKVPVPRK